MTQTDSDMNAFREYWQQSKQSTADCVKYQAEELQHFPTIQVETANASWVRKKKKKTQRGEWK